MYIRNFVFLSVVFLFACGGGSSGTAAVGNSSPAAASASNTGNITDQLQIVE